MSETEHIQAENEEVEKFVNRASEPEVREILTAVQSSLDNGQTPEFDYETSDYGVYVGDDWPLEVPEHTPDLEEVHQDSLVSAMAVHADWAEENLDDVDSTVRGDAYFLVYFK